MKPLILAVIAVFGGFWACSEGNSDRKTLAQYREGGETVPGQVISGKIEKVGRSGRNYVLKVNFTTLQNRLFNKEFSVSSSFFNSVGKDGIITQPAVEVVYLKDSPSDSILKGGTKFSPGLFWIGPLISLAGAGYLWYRLKRATADDNYNHG
jgi:hypothetical protein